LLQNNGVVVDGIFCGINKRDVFFRREFPYPIDESAPGRIF